MFKGASAGNFMGKGGLSRMFKGASGDFMGEGGLSPMFKGAADR